MTAIKSVVLLLCIGYAVSDCPKSTEDTYPCQCRTNGIDSLNCAAIRDEKDLERIFRRSINTHYTRFVLLRSKIQFIPSKYLRPRAIKYIDVRDSELDTLFDKAPRASNLIEDISMTNVSFDGEFPWHQFKTLHQLYLLSLTLVDVPVLDNAFKHGVPKNVKDVSLYSTNTEEVEDGIFADYRQLKRIRIADCQLKVLKRNYFPRPSKIESFDFNGNRIKSLPNDLFEGMPRLYYVNLSGNRISTFSEAVFGSVKKRLRILYLEKNPIQCDCGFKWILSLPSKSSIYGKCASPDDLAEKRIRDLDRKDFEYCK